MKAFLIVSYEDSSVLKGFKSLKSAEDYITYITKVDEQGGFLYYPWDVGIQEVVLE